MWLERLSSLLSNTASPVVTARGDEWGLPSVLARLREQVTLGWLEAEPRMSKDSILQGNALATALNQATGTRLFHLGLDPEAHLKLLGRYSSELTPLSLAITNAGAVPGLVQLLLQRDPTGVRLYLDYREPEQVPAGLETVHRQLVLLNPDEALQLAPQGLTEHEVLEDLELTDRNRTAFLNRMNTRAGLTARTAVPVDPTASLRTTGERHAPNLVIAALMRQKRFEDALELAVQAAPRLAEQTVEKAGPVFQAKGQLERLHVLLSALDTPWSELEHTLEWRLVAGVAAGDYRDLLPVVDAFLAGNSAPDLRARRAGLMTPEFRLAMAQEALAAGRTPITLWQAGRMNPDRNSAITLLQESVRVAEDRGSAYDIARNAGALAEAYLESGDPKQSFHWGQWALRVLDEAGIGDTDRRVRIMNAVTFAGILTGETLGLKSRLQDIMLSLDPMQPFVWSNTNMTLAALAVAEGAPHEAASYLQAALAQVPRRVQAFLAFPTVLIQLALGKRSEAGQVTSQAESISAGEVEEITRSPRLARALLQALDGKSEALDTLVPIFRDPLAQLEQRLSAWLYSRLLPEAGGKPPEDLELPLSQLADTGLRVLSAPESAFEDIWQDLLGGSADLQIQVLGQSQARLAGEPVRLTKRMWEVLLIIAMHPQGISDEELHDALVRDSAEFGLSALRTHVSRLRSLIPISDSPYRLELAYRLDLTELGQAIRTGDLRAAMRLARGPVLPGSHTSGIQEIRDDAAAELEQAVYHSSDAEVVYSLADELKEDISLWERARELLPASDARRAVAAARIGRLRSRFD